jgi:membrane fusion protein (multidrug efflux system)
MTRSLISIATVSCLLLFSCKQKQPPPAPPVPVNLFTVTSIPVTYFDKYPATTTALSQVNLLPEVQGYITAILFKEGSHVQKGQRLYELDKRIYEANENAALANLKAAQSSLVQSQQDADRYKFLDSTHAVAKQLYDHAIATLQTSKDQVKSAEEALKNTQTNMTFSTITAPFDGTIGFSQVKLGDLVNVGTTVLNTISTDDPMGIDFLINEKQLPHFEDLQNGTAKPIDSLFTLTLPNNKLYYGMGQISIIDRAVDPQTGTIRVRLVFPNPKYNLRAGMSCVVNVHNQESEPQMVIPYKAIVEQMGEFFVYVSKDTVMKDTTKGHANEPEKNTVVALQKKVKLGAVIGPNVIVKSGIKDGDKIVVDGLQALHNGSPINASDKPPGAQTGKDSTSRQKKTPDK